MCGILGVRRELVSRERAAAALDSLRWRGPDDVGLVAAGPWWLGAARLAITDPRTPQPIVDPAGGATIVFNGAVTSARSERLGLEQAAGRRTLRSGNDAELPLQRLLRDGPEALRDQTGPYALAAYQPAGDALWLAGDPMGEKPLWAACDDAGRLLAFASTPAALRLLGFPVGLGRHGRATFLRYGMVLRTTPGGGTGYALRSDFRGLFVSSGEQPLHRRPAPFAPTAARVGLPLDTALRAAVVRCADAEVPVALSLSGGIDSACIAACMPRSRTGAWHAYQFRALGEPDDERQRAQAVAALHGLRLHDVDAGPDLLRALPGLTRRLGLPLGDPSVLAVCALARRAAADGVKVLLSGEGADDLLLGYPRHRAARWLPRRGLRWLPLPRALRLGRSRQARLARAWTARQPYDALLEIAPTAFRSAVLDPRLVADDAGALPESPGSALQRARQVDRSCYLRLDLLPKLDTATLTAAVEGRCPFLDPEVLLSREVTAADPRPLVGKRPLRAAFAAHLPEGHLRQPKRGFAIPIDRWLREDDFLPDLLRDRRCLEREWVAARGLTRMLDSHRAGDVDVGHALWAVAALELFDRCTEDPVEAFACG